MGNEPLVLTLIVADCIEDEKGHPRVDDFRFGFVLDFLSEGDLQEAYADGVPSSYGIVKKRRAGEEGSSDASLAIPYVINGIPRRINWPVRKGNYTDAQLHESLPDALSLINLHLIEGGAQHLVIATERPEAAIVGQTFRESGYDVREYEKVPSN